ncbi:MAG: hypothetical protein KatS3mg031_2987 [Chitinophagales bacterium]|nr:MAG: hypothetical protein KatS3mg031_2987 [Chitinophagales bacterium]
MPPAAKPLELEEVKAWLQVVADDEDDLLQFLIDSATNMLENQYDIALITRTVEFYADYFPADGVIILPLRPVANVLSIEYLDAAKNWQVLPVSVYDISANDPKNYAEILREYGQTWPEIYYCKSDCVKITANVGHGATSADIPAELRLEMQAVIRFWYDNREDIALGSGMRSANLPLHGWKMWL